MPSFTRSVMCQTVQSAYQTREASIIITEVCCIRSSENIPSTVCIYGQLVSCCISQRQKWAIDAPSLTDVTRFEASKPQSLQSLILGIGCGGCGRRGCRIVAQVGWILANALLDSTAHPNTRCDALVVTLMYLEHHHDHYSSHVTVRSSGHDTSA